MYIAFTFIMLLGPVLLLKRLTATCTIECSRILKCRHYVIRNPETKITVEILWRNRNAVRNETIFGITI